MTFFELQGDEGDEERVKLNLIELSREQGTLERNETKDEIKFKGMIIVGEKMRDNKKEMVE
jgi:hypothetical protein